jgi:hypothetical protein
LRVERGRRRGRFELCPLVVAQDEIGRAEQVFELLQCPRSEHRCSHAVSAEQPGDRDLRDRRSVCRGDLGGGVDHPEVAFHGPPFVGLLEVPRRVADAAPLEVEHRVRRKDGSYRWVLARGVAMRDGSGVEITFRPVPGLNAPWLQRLVSCHQARNAAIGYDQASADMPSCPLALPGTQATVSAVDDGVALTVRSDDTDIAKRILRRADMIQQQPQIPETRPEQAD